MKRIYQYLRMLLLLSDEDLKEFEKFLNSEYHCNNQAARRLFDFLYQNYLPNLEFLKELSEKTIDELSKSPFFDKELLFSQAFGHKSNGNYGRLDTLMTHSKQLLEQFFVFESLKNDSYMQKLYLLRALKTRDGFDVFFENKMKEVQEMMNQIPLISIKQLLFQFWFNEIDYAYKITHDKDEAETTASFMTLLTSINKYLGTLYLKYSAEVINREEIFTKKQNVKEFHPLFLLPQVLWLIGRRATFLSIPVINLYYNLIKSLTLPYKIEEERNKGNEREVRRLENKENNYYLHLKEELSMQIIQAPIKVNQSEKEANVLKVDLLNVNDATCNYLIRRGRDKENRIYEPFNLSEEIFNLKLLEAKYNLSAVTPNRYIAFVKANLKIILRYNSMGNLVEANQKQIILDTYRSENWAKMSEEEKRQLRPFIEGLKIVYGNHSTENIRGIIRKLGNSTLTSVIEELSRRVLLLQLYYKAQDFVAVSKEVLKFRAFLNSHQELSRKKADMHRSFANFMSLLSNLKQKQLLGVNINARRNKTIQTIQPPLPLPVKGGKPIEDEWLIGEFLAL